jgi:hypothetical protein
MDITKVSMLKHFGHSKVRKSKPGLSGSISRNAVISPHFLQSGLLITFTNIAHPPNSQFYLPLQIDGQGQLQLTFTTPSGPARSRIQSGVQSTLRSASSASL